MKTDNLVFLASVFFHILSAFGTARANAQALSLDIENLSWAGTGCRGDGQALSAKLSEKSGRLIVYFPELEVSLKTKPLERKACSLSLAVSVPLGKRLVVGKPSVFGRSTLTGGALGRVEAEAFFAGVPGGSILPIAVKDLVAGKPSGQDFYVRQPTSVAAPCGVDAIVRANVSVLGRRVDVTDQALVRVSGTALTMELEDCSEL